MDNLNGILLMVAAMAGFALEDMFIKLVAVEVPTGQILVMLGWGGALVFGLWARAIRQRLFGAVMFTRPMWVRNLGEVLGTVSFVTAITLTPLSSASAIQQATPLAVTLGAALFLAAPVGWRRWTAILVGFLGVLIVVRPGLSGFVPASLFAVAAVVGLAIRDLGTRVAPAAVSSIVLSAWGFAMVGIAGLVLLPFGARMVIPSPLALAGLTGALAVGVLGYYALTASVRIGDIATITPFRYTRLLFALTIGMTVFGERPDRWTLFGAAVIILSGLYTILREQRLRRRALDAANAPRAAATRPAD
ncbi:MAG: DMT family transporter [Rhodobacteraceae bacterium]|nr:DMT family transporter [Paracoccaceae bacterium]